ncbi:MAG: hypothetical protein UW03_C0023G0001, partial [Candidatus Peregrinibacteria bacterium GW2011_GWA2_43_8]
ENALFLNLLNDSQCFLLSVAQNNILRVNPSLVLARPPISLSDGLVSPINVHLEINRAHRP